MNLSSFIEKKARELQKYIEKDAPRILAKMARDHAKQSFQAEGYTDDTLQPWQEVERRNPARMRRNKDGTISKRQARDQRRKILSDTGELARSIQSDVISSELVEIGSDLPYAQAHNEGTDNAGRNHNVKIPQRQFIGKSKKLEDEIVAKFEKDITNILNS